MFCMAIGINTVRRLATVSTERLLLIRFNEAYKGWGPGQTFSFILINVTALFFFFPNWDYTLLNYVTLDFMTVYMYDVYMFFYKHNVHKHNEVQISKKLSIF